MFASLSFPEQFGHAAEASGAPRETSELENRILHVLLDSVLGNRTEILTP
jgi:hypothetical protein